MADAFKDNGQSAYELLAQHEAPLDRKNCESTSWPLINRPHSQDFTVWQGSSLVEALVKASELLRMLASDGWSRVRQSGSHAIYRHPTKAGQLTVPVHPGKEVPRGIAERLLKAAGIK